MEKLDLCPNCYVKSHCDNNNPDLFHLPHNVKNKSSPREILVTRKRIFRQSSNQYLLPLCPFCQIGQCTRKDSNFYHLPSNVNPPSFNLIVSALYDENDPCHRSKIDDLKAIHNNQASDCCYPVKF